MILLRPLIFILLTFLGIILIVAYVQMLRNPKPVKRKYRPKFTEVHRHTIHCCKADILESTYHTYRRMDGGVYHLENCRCKS